MLRFFFKPKWKHRNPVKRLRGVQELSASLEEQHAILIEIAANDLDPRVRLKSVEKLCDLSSLNQIIANEPDDIVRSTAQNRYYSLLAGTATDSTPDIVTGRYRIVDDSEDEDLKKFYHEFMVSEAGHYRLFLDLAYRYASKEHVSKRWEEYLVGEAEILKNLEVRGDRVH